MKTPRIFAYAICAALTCSAVSGCGPGMPFMTAEQEDLITNVDRLMKENEALNKRLASIEAGGGADGLKKEIASIKASVARTNMEIEKLRHEFSFVRGATEESQHAKDDLKGSLNDLGAKIGALNEKITALDAADKSSASAIVELKGLISGAEARISEIKAMVAALDGRISSMPAASAVKAASDPEALYAKGYKETMDKDYNAAMETFREILASHPGHRYASNAQYWLAEINYAKGEWEKAIVEFDKVKKKYPKSEKIAASTLKQGFAFDKLGSRKEARLLLEEVVERFPGTPEAELAKKKLETLK